MEGDNEMSEDEEMKREIWSIMCARGIDFNQAKALYRKQLEKKLAGYESKLDKEVAEEKEQITNEIFAMAKEAVFATVKGKYGIELIENPESGEIIFENEPIFNLLIPLLRDLSPLLAHEETKHVSIELTRGADETWNIKILNRAE